MYVNYSVTHYIGLSMVIFLLGVNHWSRVSYRIGA